jgi:hypothetical protein
LQIPKGRAIKKSINFFVLVSPSGMGETHLLKDRVPSPFMVRQAHHERTTTQKINYFAVRPERGLLGSDVEGDERRIAPQSLEGEGGSVIRLLQDRWVISPRGD